MTNRRHIPKLMLAMLAGAALLPGQTSTPLEMYRESVFYPRTQQHFFLRSSLEVIGVYSSQRITLTGPFRMRVSENFFRTYPEAMTEIAIFRSASRNQSLATLTALASQAAVNYFAARPGVYPVLETKAAYLSAGANVAILWALAEGRKSFNALYQALHLRNMQTLQLRLTAETYEHYSTNSIRRVLLPLGGSALLVNGRFYKVSAIAGRKDDAVHLFAANLPSAAAYRDFQSASRRAWTFSVLTPAPFIGATALAVNSKNGVAVIGFMVSGLTATLAMIEKASHEATVADNHLDHAIYLYNGELLSGMQPD